MPTRRSPLSPRLRALALAMLLLPAGGLPARADTTVFVVRHAEKVDASEDAELSADGRERARLLRDMLRSLPLSAVYASKYRRTRQTVAPAAEAAKTPVTIHQADEIPGLAAALRRAAADSVERCVLVAGHANTTAQWVRELGGPADLELLDHEWDNLFVITLGSGGRSRFLRLHYGY